MADYTVRIGGEEFVVEAPSREAAEAFVRQELEKEARPKLPNPAADPFSRMPVPAGSSRPEGIFEPPTASDIGSIALDVAAYGLGGGPGLSAFKHLLKGAGAKTALKSLFSSGPVGTPVRAGMGLLAAKTTDDPGDLAGLAVGRGASEGAGLALKGLNNPLFRALFSATAGPAVYEASRQAPRLMGEEPNPRDLLAMGASLLPAGIEMARLPVARGPMSLRQQFGEIAAGQPVPKDIIGRLMQKVQAPFKGNLERLAQAEFKTAEDRAAMARHRVTQEAALDKAARQAKVQKIDLQKEIQNLTGEMNEPPVAGNPALKAGLQRRLDELKIQQQQLPLQDKARATASSNVKAIKAREAEIKGELVRIKGIRESLNELASGKGKILATGLSSKFLRAADEDEFLSMVYGASDDDWTALKKYMMPQEEAAVSNGFGRWFAQKSADAGTGLPTKAAALIDELTTDKIQRYFGVENTKRLAQVVQDLNRFNKPPMLPVAGRIWRAVQMGADQLIRDSKLGEEFHKWAMEDATPNALRKLPVLRQWLEEYVYERER